MKMTTDVNWAAQGALFEFNIQHIVNKNVFLESARMDAIVQHRIIWTGQENHILFLPNHFFK